jgi:uncharacterized DUF497 family protein
MNCNLDLRAVLKKAKSAGGQVGPWILVVVHTWIENEEEDVIRIISARRATASERRRYEES